MKGLLQAQCLDQRAIVLYFRGIDADPVAEALLRGLMRCCPMQHKYTEAIGEFPRIRQTLSTVLCVLPLMLSRKLYEKSISACGEAVLAHDRVLRK